MRQSLRGSRRPMGCRSRQPFASRCRTDEYLAHYKVKEFVSQAVAEILSVAAESRHLILVSAHHGVGHRRRPCRSRRRGRQRHKLDGRPFVYGKIEEKFANPFFVGRGRS